MESRKLSPDGKQRSFESMVVVNVVKGHIGLKYTDSTGIKKIAKCSKV